MNDIFQGGNKKIMWPYFKGLLNYLSQMTQRNIRKGNCLDLGSGTAFYVEEFLNNHFSEMRFDCIDISEYNGSLPSYVNSYTQKSIEEEIICDVKYDIILAFECIEHIDKTDVLLKNCYNNLKDDGVLFIAMPNLASIFSRIELLFGFQPHVLEVSNEYADFGMGIFGKKNNPSGKTIHHIRGITHKAMIEMLQYHGFSIVKVVGSTNSKLNILNRFPSIASDNMYICKKVKSV